VGGFTFVNSFIGNNGLVGFRGSLAKALDMVTDSVNFSLAQHILRVIEIGAFAC
jgi:hypothetical protein